MKKHIAFTLAEVLVTLGIIGVISALTMPTLINDYRKQALTVQIRKITNDFENAADMFTTEEGKTKFSLTSAFKDDGVAYFMQSKFKAKPCSGSTSCFASGLYRSIDGSDNEAFTCDGEAFLLANSAAVCIKKEESADMLRVFVDTNGAQPPNMGGRDMFRFYLTANGQIDPESHIYAEFCTQHTSKCYDSGICLPSMWYDNCKGCESKAFGQPCLGQLQESNWEMNY